MWRRWWPMRDEFMVEDIPDAEVRMHRKMFHDPAHSHVYRLILDSDSLVIGQLMGTNSIFVYKKEN